MTEEEKNSLIALGLPVEDELFELLKRQLTESLGWVERNDS